jgi:hypothetical protein
MSYLRKNTDDEVIGRYAQFCVTHLKTTRVMPRRMHPSTMEINVSFQVKPSPNRGGKWASNVV